MINKKLMVLAIFLVSLLAVSVVSAADNITDDVASADDATEDVAYVENGQMILEANDVGTFTDLANVMANATGKVDLNKNYRFSDGDSKYAEGIMIDKGIAINGNGFTIDGNGKARAFQISASDVVLRNIDFVNCHAEYEGGAVYWTGTGGTMSDCSFKNCSVGYEGGAVCWFGADGDLSGCSFENCYASSGYSNGGAVYWGSTGGDLTDCSFVKCSAENEGGAVCLHASNSTLSGCTFEDCSSVYIGGAVFCYAYDCGLSDCSFVNCTVESYGGAVAWYTAGGYLSDCSFEDCSAFGAYGAGGAVELGASDISLSDCSFVNCFANDDGGAVSWRSDDGYLSGCSFVNCFASDDGGAVHWSGDNGVVEKSSFTDCHASDCGGGICFDASDCSLLNPIFDDNSASNGFDVYSAESLNVVDATADKLSSEIIAPDVVMPYSGSKNMTITLMDVIDGNPMAGKQISISFDNSSYTETTDSKGQVSFTIPDNLNLGNHVADISYSGNGAYYPSATSATVTVNKMDTRILAVQNVEDSELVATLTTVEGKALANEAMVVDIGSGLYTEYTDSKGRIKVSTANMTSGRHTALFYYWGSSNYNPSSRPINVYINESAGTVRTLIDLANEIANADGKLVLTRNYTYDSSCDSIYKDGITVDKSIVIDGNGYTVDGSKQSRIFNIAASDVVLNDICFANCSSGSGGAIYWSGLNGELSDCSFVNSVAQYGAGAAVYWIGADGDLSDCSFVDCSAGTAGVVYWEGSSGTLSDCSFVNCSAKYSGGAVCWFADDGILSGSSFVNCSAYHGGAVYWDLKSGLLSDCCFVNCSASNNPAYWAGSNGGAVYWSSEDGIIEKSSFMNCHADEYGGGIYFDDENSALIYPVFSGNTAKDGSNWYNVTQVSVIISTVISASDVSTVYGESAELIASLSYADDNPVAGEEISIVLDGVKYALKTDSDGKASFEIPTNLAGGTYDAAIAYAGNNIYANSSASATVVVNKAQSKIYLRNALYFVLQTKMVTVTLWDADNNPIAGKTVHITLDEYGLKYSGVTDEKGEASIRVGVGFGVHSATVSFDGDENYTASERTGSIRVIKETPSVMVRGADAQVKASDNPKIIKVYLKDRYNKPLLVGTKIFIKIDGKTFVGTTDSEGIAHVEIKVNRAGLFNAQVIYTGNTAYNAVNRNVKITVK